MKLKNKKNLILFVSIIMIYYINSLFEQLFKNVYLK